MPTAKSSSGHMIQKLKKAENCYVHKIITQAQLQFFSHLVSTTAANLFVGDIGAIQFTVRRQLTVYSLRFTV